jgi:hypothetical protein
MKEYVPACVAGSVRSRPIAAAGFMTSAYPTNPIKKQRQADVHTQEYQHKKDGDAEYADH